jgi:arylsulfatase A-like enzyme/Flp pilus assembly protein TadD
VSRDKGKGRGRAAEGTASAAPARRRATPWLVALAAVAGVGALFIHLRRQADAPAPSPRSRDNFLLVTLDTTRADRLGCYGWPRARTRHLDRLAAEGARFETAFSPAPITLPAHASIFTGLLPPEHGVRNNGNFYLPDRFGTLATVLHGQGYRTAAFVSSFVLDRRYGLARGFDTYDDRLEGAQPQIISLEAERRGDRTALALGSWLEAHAAARTGAPFFAWLHLYDPHEPYRPPRPFRDLFADAPYDGEIAFDDAVVASVLDRLGQLGLGEKTLVAVVGDHGESLGEHGEETHSMLLYEGALRIPLILWRPGLVPAGVVVREPVRATDVAATVLELLGAPTLKTRHARSLVPLLHGASAGVAPPVYAETLLPQLYMNWAPLFSLRDERFKLIEAPRPELYDLARDPGEERNLFAEEPEKARAMGESLRQLTGGSTGAMSVGTLDREAMEKLAALGYVGAGVEPGPADAARVQVDPKDMIAIFNRLRRANSAVRDRRFSEALPILHEVLKQDPRNAFARLVLGSAYMGMERYAQAINWFRKYLELVPTSAYAHHWMAICQLRRGDRDEALREAAAALAIDPRFADARVLRGGVLAARGDHPGAIEELRAAVATDPAKPILRLDLAKVLAEAGRAAEARAEYEAALRLKPDYAPALVGLGALQAEGGDPASAMRSFRRALEIDPGNDEARFNLARVLEGRGQRAEAEVEYRRLVEKPETPAAIRSAARKRLSPAGR